MVVEYKVADFGFVRYYLAPKVGPAMPGWVVRQSAAACLALQRLPVSRIPKRFTRCGGTSLRAWMLPRCCCRLRMKRWRENELGHKAAGASCGAPALASSFKLHRLDPTRHLPSCTSLCTITMQLCSRNDSSSQSTV